eukprot:762905-Hanusia_phi.AAC.2
MAPMRLNLLAEQGERRRRKTGAQEAGRGQDDKTGGAQEHRSTGAQEHRSTGAQEHRKAGRRKAGRQEDRKTGRQEGGRQEDRKAGAHEGRSTGAQEHRKAGRQEDNKRTGGGRLEDRGGVEWKDNLILGGRERVHGKSREAVNFIPCRSVSSRSRTAMWRNDDGRSMWRH